MAMGAGEMAGTAGVAGTLAMSNPWTAAAMVGSQFLMNYMNQSAADRQQKAQLMAQAKQQEGQAAGVGGGMEQQALDRIMSGYGQALR